MTLRSATLTLTFLALALVARPVVMAAEDKIEGDLARLQGSWTTKGGPEKNIPISLTIKGKVAEIALTLPDGRPVNLRGEIKIDEAASPKQADWVKFANPRGGEVADNLAIYKLEGDTWTVCAGGLGNDRPSEFKAGTDGPPNLSVWSRAKTVTVAYSPPAPKDAELARFQGTWRADTGPGGTHPVTLHIQGNAIRVSWPRGDGEHDELKGEFRVDEKAEPKTIDFLGFKKVDGDTMKESLGIYAFEGETLRICVGGPDEERPSEFKANPEGFPLLLLFRKGQD